jgi:hypothetical protein
VPLHPAILNELKQWREKAMYGTTEDYLFPSTPHEDKHPVQPGSVLEGSVHALDLPICPRMLWFDPAMFYIVLLAGPGKNMNPEEQKQLRLNVFLGRGLCLGRLRCVVYKVRSIISEYGVDGVGNGNDQSSEKIDRDSSRGAFVELGKGEFAGPVDGNEQIELAVFNSHLRDINMEIADGVQPELFLCGLVAFNIGQPADTVPLKKISAAPSGSA